MNRRDLTLAVARNLDCHRDDATKAIDAVVAAIKQGVREDGKVSLARFGTFTRKTCNPRRLTNPATGQPMTIPAFTTIKFKASEGVREKPC